MARGEPPDSGPPRSDRPQLPAPYRSPWSGLAEALRAVAADLRLSLQRLWRRNLEGELPLPARWPQGLAPLFWPLLLSLVVVLLVGLGGWWLQLAGRSKPPAAGVAADRAALTATAARPIPSGPGLEPADRSLLGDGVRMLPGSAQTTGGSSAGDADRGSSSSVMAGQGRARPPGYELQDGWPAARGQGRGEVEGDRAAASGGGATEPGSTEAGNTEAGSKEAGSAPTPQLRLDPLLELLSQGDDAELLLAARPDPAGSRLSLTLSPAAEALPQPALLQQALRWQQRAREAGYERLELRDAQGRLRGRGALVGSGMILLAPVPGC